MKPVLNRRLNHHHSTYERQPDGSIREVKHPYQCDDCLTRPAIYGCIEEHGKWLRCSTCHLQSEARIAHDSIFQNQTG
jgi:hypothetical protein